MIIKLKEFILLDQNRGGQVKMAKSALGQGWQRDKGVKGKGGREQKHKY